MSCSSLPMLISQESALGQTHLLGQDFQRIQKISLCLSSLFLQLISLSTSPAVTQYLFFSSLPRMFHSSPPVNYPLEGRCNIEYNNPRCIKCYLPVDLRGYSLNATGWSWRQPRCVCSVAPLRLFLGWRLLLFARRPPRRPWPKLCWQSCPSRSCSTSSTKTCRPSTRSPRRAVPGCALCMLPKPVSPTESACSTCF